MKKFSVEIAGKEKVKREKIVLGNIVKALAAAGLALKKLAVHSLLHLGSLFEKEVEYGGSKIDKEIMERIIHDLEEKKENDIIK